MADVLEGSGIAAAGVSETAVFEIARDDSVAGEAGAEGANVLQIIGGLPETIMNHKEQREGSLAFGVSQLGKLARVSTVPNSLVKRKAEAFPEYRSSPISKSFGCQTIDCYKCMCKHKHRLAMAVKTITVTEEAYKLLAKEKKGEESFSQVIKRLTGDRGTLADSLGAWKVSEKEAEEVFSSLRKHWKRADARIRGRAKPA